VAKLADAPGLGPGPERGGGSSPLARTFTRSGRVKSQRRTCYVQHRGEVMLRLDILHAPIDGIAAADQNLQTLRGADAYSAVFDNTKIRSLVPEFRVKVPFAREVRESVAWFGAYSARRAVDDAANALWDQLATVYAGALSDYGAAYCALPANVSGIPSWTSPDRCP
jgi:hypothetical protein